MFNMKTSDLFKRAKQLADLEGSDFISWNEAINCINESNVGLYEKLINMGDNSFVSDFHMKAESKVLPEDFWQLKGVYLWNNGNLQTINRRADNNGIHHLSYELRNGSIHIYGNPDDVFVQYYPKPKKLFFKPNTVSIALDDAEYLDCCKHTFLYKSVNTSSQQSLSVIDLDGVKTVKDFLQIAHDSIISAHLTDNFVFVETLTNLIIYDLATGYSVTVSGYVPLITENGNEYIVDSEGVVKSFQVGNGTIVTSEVKNITYIGGSYYVCDDNLSDFFYLENGFVKHNGEEVTLILAEKIIYSEKKCYCLRSTGFFVVDENNEATILEGSTGFNIGFVGIDERTGFGYCSKKFGKYFVNPYCEDTPLNYPNSTYFQIIAYILAIAFRSKQGADISLLQNELAMIEQTFEETLGSDAFQFPRMGNVYN